MCVRPSVRMPHLGSQWKNFRAIWYWRLLRNSFEQNLNLIKIVLKYRALCKYIADRHTKYSIARLQCKMNTLLLFYGKTFSIFVLLNRNVWLKETQRTHCCITTSTMVTRLFQKLHYTCSSYLALCWLYIGTVRQHMLQTLFCGFVRFIVLTSRD